MKVSARSAIPMVVLTVAAYFLFRVHEILLPFILAGVLAYLFNPLVRFFEVQGLRRRPVVVILYVTVMSLAALIVYKIVIVAALEAEEAAQNMPFYVQKGGELFSRMRGSINPDLFETIAQHGRAWPQEVLQKMPSFALGFLPIIEIAFLVPFIGFFLIQEGPRLRDHILGWVPSRYVEMVLGLMVELDNSLGKYARGLALESLCVGCIALAGFWAIHLDYALQIAMVVGLANVIPYVGPVLGLLLGGSVALFQWGSLVGLIKVVAVCVGVRFIEDWFIQPTVMRRSVHLHPVLIVFALMSGAKLFGFWGLLFGVPIACMAKVLLDVLLPWYRSQYGLSVHVALPEVSRVPLI